MNKQRVHFGVTEYGTPGLFTDHYMAIKAPRQAAERYGFEYVPQVTEHQHGY